MPHFDIIRESRPEKSFRVESVMGTFDLNSERVKEHFVGDINLPNKWNIGLIVGRSGSVSGLIQNKNIKGSTSRARVTAAFEYIGDK